MLMTFDAEGGLSLYCTGTCEIDGILRSLLVKAAMEQPPNIN